MENQSETCGTPAATQRCGEPQGPPSSHPLFNELATTDPRSMVSGAPHGRGVMDITQCSLTELVDDPLIGLVMKSDGVDRRTIELLFARIARERSAAAEAR